MSLIFKITVDENGKPGNYHITWLNKQTRSENSFDSSASDLTEDELLHLWTQAKHQLPIGRKLFHFLDGDGRFLEQAVSQGQKEDKPVILQLYPCREVENWPFELLASPNENSFLLVNRVHLVRCVSEWGAGKETKPGDRALKMIFMACSALDVEPELDFEKEEEAIVSVTEKLQVDIEVEDSGSLEGLGQKLLHTRYDVVHLMGHANIEENKPVFLMEDELGYPDLIDAKNLWAKALKHNPPKILFLSGCHTGETPVDLETSSFAGELVKDFKLPWVLGWGRPVSDDQAMTAAEVLYRELSRGQEVLKSVSEVRDELIREYNDSFSPAWPLLRVFGSEMVMGGLVTEGQKVTPKARELKHRYLKSSRVQILETGFVGRRRQLQSSLRALLKNKNKVGVLLHGAGGLGKSCLAGKLCERFSDHHLIIVHGRFNAITLEGALKDAFIASNDEKGENILESQKEMSEKLAKLCAGSFKEKNYLIVLDDFEQNLENIIRNNPTDTLPKVFEGQGNFLQKVPLPPEANIVLTAESSVLLHTLLHYLPFSGKVTQVVVTSRYLFSLTENDCDLVSERLEPVSLTSFRGPERWKKARELLNIMGYLFRDATKVGELVSMGRGNPRLMEWIDKLVGEMKDAEVGELLGAVKGKQEEFIRSHVMRELVMRSGESVEKFLKAFSIYRRAVLKAGAGSVSVEVGVDKWEECLRRSVSLSLVEYDGARDLYGVTEMLREELEKSLPEEDRVPGHRGAMAYYKSVCEKLETIDPVLQEEWIFHALKCGEEEVASEQGGWLVKALLERLAFLEGVRVGEWVLSEKKKDRCTGHDAFLLNELAATIDDLGDKRKAIGYYEQALAIDVKVFGNDHPNVAIRLNNLGSAWKALGEPKKAMGYYEQALAIDVNVFGNEHPNVAIRLNNLGAAWDDLGDKEKAIGYYEQALAIWKEVYGEAHPQVAIGLNNLGGAWQALGETKKAIGYYEQALAIDVNVFGNEHPNVARELNNLGLAWQALGETKKAIGYYEQALAIDERVYGKEHPDVAIDLNNLGAAYFGLGDKKRAKTYFEKAYAIKLKFFGPNHPSSRTTKEWLEDC